jgi:hypothetical protein
LTDKQEVEGKNDPSYLYIFIYMYYLK